MDYLHKIKTFYRKLRPSPVAYAGGSIYPRRDWTIILSSVIVCLIILALVAVYFYVQIDRGVLFSKTSEDLSGGVNINSILLQKTVDAINVRETRLSNLKQNKTKTPDPSL